MNIKCRSRSTFMYCIQIGYIIIRYIQTQLNLTCVIEISAICCNFMETPQNKSDLNHQMKLQGVIVGIQMQIPQLRYQHWIVLRRYLYRQHIVTIYRKASANENVDYLEIWIENNDPKWSEKFSHKKLCMTSTLRMAHIAYAVQNIT